MPVVRLRRGLKRPTASAGNAASRTSSGSRDSARGTRSLIWSDTLWLAAISKRESDAFSASRGRGGGCRQGGARDGSEWDVRRSPPGVHGEARPGEDGRKAA